MKRNGYIKTVKYSCGSSNPFDYGSVYRCSSFAHLQGKMPSWATKAQLGPYVISEEEIASEYDSVVEYTAVAAVYSFQRSRRWNIKQLEWYLKMGLTEGSEERFFRYHAVQLMELFGNSRQYMTAMREIERRCNLTSGTAYHPEVVKAFREGRRDEYNALSGHCDEIEVVNALDENLEPPEPEVHEEIEETCE